MKKLGVITDKIRRYGLRQAGKRALYRFASNVVHTRIDFTYELYKLFCDNAIRDVNGFKMFLDLKHDEGISKDLFIYRKREHLSTDFLLSSGFIKKGDAVLDIGANIGYYALIESKLTGSKGVVYALEPVHKNYEILKKNIELNSISNIEAYNIAAGDANTTARINVGRKGNLSSFVNRGYQDYTSQEEIPVVRVDDFLKDKRTPSFVRMDVEGYEYAIIEGMREILQHDDLTLLIEIHPTILTTSQMEKMFNTLKKSGFTSATMIFDPPLRSLTGRGHSKPFSNFLREELEDKENRNPKEPTAVTIDQLMDLLKRKNRHIHAFIHKAANV